jgi:hypothetical protein
MDRCIDEKIIKYEHNGGKIYLVPGEDKVK